MGILDKLKRKAETTLSETRLEDELIYEKILEEMESGFTQKGLYAKALANCSGNEKLATSLYLKYRLRSVKDSLDGKSYIDYYRQALSSLKTIGNENDEDYYLIATNEFEDGNIDKGVWAKSMTLNKGDEKLAKYDYIERRVKTLISNAQIENQARRAYLIQIVKEEYEKIKKWKRYIDSGSELELSTNDLFPRAFNQHEKNNLISKLQDQITYRIEKELV